MVSAVLTHTTKQAKPPSLIVSLAKRFVNALVASRIATAERELRRHEALIHETARLHGDFRRVGLDRADLLPFSG
jgi:hypothetical protein